ncbi:MAG: HisA/HisF-related TIM barrel protein [Methylococcaceae bacterium]|nr:HisA/HisF-related TIM barrel protein [Methylococcaceae bacterium]
MKIIPVIDIKNGLVVSAQQGKRETYQPIKSTLCFSNSLQDILKGFLSIYPFGIVYIADLNAITNTGSNDKLINQVISKHPGIEFWIDNGKRIEKLSKSQYKNQKSVVGSEYQKETISYDTSYLLQNNILSLDFFPNQGYIGPKELLNNAKLWPQNIIIMSLAFVGKNSGPDLNRLESFCQKHPEKNIIAAGGVRNEKDLLALKKIGIYYALVASALHSGAITANTIKKIRQKNTPVKN